MGYGRPDQLLLTMLVIAAIVAGVLLVVGLIFGGIFLAVKPDLKNLKNANDAMRAANNLLTVFRVQQFLTFLVLIGMSITTTLVVKHLKEHVDYRR